MRMAINGAGVAGPALAYWLLRSGHEPVLIERAPEFRTGGYMIDFWGVGYDIAERMGILPEVKRLGYSVGEVRLVGDQGERVGGFSASVFDRMTKGRFTSLPRGDLAATIFRTLGVDHTKEYRNVDGRPIFTTDNGQPIREMFA